MIISKSQSKKPIFKGEVWVTKKDHGIELGEPKSKGADKRCSVLYVGLTKLEFLKMFKVILLGKKSSRLKSFVVGCLAWLLDKAI